MLHLDENPSLVQIYDALYRLGIIGNYLGFFYTAYAVWLCLRQPERLLFVTKWLYPDVAAHYKTNWLAVERDIRTVITIIWERNPSSLSQLAGYQLTEKPKPAQFLTLLVSSISSHSAA